MSVWGGALIGATAGWMAWWAFLLIARRRLIGRPVDVDDSEVMTLVVQLADTARRATDLHVLDPDLDVDWTARHITYQVVDPHLTTEGFVRLRYQTQMLDHAVGQALRAQANLDAATAAPATTVSRSASTEPGGSSPAATAERLTAHAVAMDEIAGQVRAVRRTWPAAN